MGDNEIVTETDLVPELWPSAEYMVNLRDDQREIAERYLTHYDLNRAVQEVRKFERRPHDNQGGYTQAVRNTASTLRKNPNFLGYLAARMKEIAMPPDRVIREIGRIAGASIEDFLRDDMLEAGQAVFDLAKAQRTGVLPAIKKFEITTTAAGKQVVRFELYDKLEALKTLGKHFNLLKETEVEINEYVITVVRKDEVIEVVDGG